MSPTIMLLAWTLAGGGIRAPSPLSPAYADTVEIVPGPEYAASAITRFFLGDHHRDIWTTPIRVPLLDFRARDGGLAPTTAGGGRQSRNLRFEGGDGAAWAFRLIHKRSDSFVPPALEDTFVEELIADAMCLHFPYGALVAEPLQRAAGLLTIPVDLFVLADDPALGDHRAEFGGRLGLFSPRILTGAELLGSPGTATEILEGAEIVRRLSEDPAQRIRAREYLTARLLDMMIGDWDRHPSQWSWVRFTADPQGWRPVPEDRDVAFSRLDGLAWALARTRLPHFAHYEADYGSVVRLHYQSRFLDRFLLAGLERSAWDDVATRLRDALTDDVLSRALARLPEPALAVDDEELATALRARRDALPSVADALYELLAERPDIHASDRADLAAVTVGERWLRIELRTPGVEEPYFDRTFQADETDEIRLYLHGGDDVVLSAGDARPPIPLRIVGGPGDDRYDFRVPLDARIYDSEGSFRLDRGASRIDVDRRSWPRHPVVPERGDPAPVRDWGARGMPTAWLGVDHDAGVIARGRYDWSFFGFRKSPFGTRLTLQGSVSSRLRKELRARVELRAAGSSRLAVFDAWLSDLETLHYFGSGNDSERLDPAPRDFYDTERLVTGVGARVGRALGDLSRVTGGVVGTYSRTGDRQGSFIGGIPDLYGDGAFAHLGLEARARGTTSRDPVFDLVEPRPRFDAEFIATLYPAVLDVEDAYGVFETRLSGALPLGERASEVAARLGARVVAGDAPWFDLAFIGGGSTLRGFRRNRFAGDRSLYGSLGLRLDLFDIRLIVPSTFGVHGLVDAGRVWVDGESPGGWHTALGGGVWFTLRGTRSLIALTYARSDEGGSFYAGIGFPY